MGDRARAVGEGAASFAESVWTFNQRHNLGEKAAAAAKASYQAAADFESEHNVSERASQLASEGWQTLNEFNDNTQLTTRLGNAAGAALDSVTALMSGRENMPESRGEFEARLKRFWERVNDVDD